MTDTSLQFSFNLHSPTKTSPKRAHIAIRMDGRCSLLHRRPPSRWTAAACAASTSTPPPRCATSPSAGSPAPAPRSAPGARGARGRGAASGSTRRGAAAEFDQHVLLSNEGGDVGGGKRRSQDLVEYHGRTNESSSPSLNEHLEAA